MTKFCKSNDKPIEFVLPASLRLVDVLPRRLWTRCDDARWLVDVILRKTANRDVDPWGLVRLHSCVLQRVMYQPTQAVIVRELVDAGVIERAPHRAGHRASGYRIGQRFLCDRCVRVRCQDPRLVDRIVREHDRMKAEEQFSRWLPVHFQLDREQRRLTIGREADAILGELPSHTRLCQHVLVDRLRRGEFRQTISSTGRLFNAITGLKSELRETLLLEDQPLGSVDIAACQPSLLALMLTGKIPPYVPKWLLTYKHTPVAPSRSPDSSSSSPADVVLFSALVLRGDFYSRLSDVTGLDRPTVKKRFLVDVLAKKGRYPSTVESAFRQAFPSVHRAIKRINQRDHGELIRTLQRLEASLVVETVAPRLLAQRFPIVTVHDCVYSRRDDIDSLVAAFTSVFRELGFSLALHVTGEEP